MTRLRRPRSDDAQSPLELYLREINDTPLLTAAEEKCLARRILEGDTEARDHMVRANLRLVVNIARGYTGRGLALQDLIEEGNLGLMRAVEGFDPDMNTRFSTYAAFWVKQSLKRALVNTGKTVRVPAYTVELLAKWRRASHKLTDELGRAPAPEEVGKLLGLSKKKLSIVQRALSVYAGSPQADQGEDGWSLEELLPDGRTRTPDAELVESEDLRRMRALLETMDAREAAVLRMRFGLGGAEPRTLKEIGDELGLTRERVRQIEAEALGKLNTSLGGEMRS